MERLDWPSCEKELSEGYENLKRNAELLRFELLTVANLGHLPPSAADAETLSKLHSISTGKVASAISLAQPLPVRAVARDILAQPSKAQGLLTADFEDYFRYGTSQNPPLALDAIRKRVTQRKVLLEAVLPETMQQAAGAALAQVERQYLQRQYVNAETMLGDRVDNIPQANLFVSEDDYAWDMDELAQAIQAKYGVMRNPLSRAMFSPTDIQQILAHPLGARLKPLTVAQEQLKGGVRPATIERVERLGRVMLADQSLDGAPSQVAVDEFLAHVLTLPATEQRAVNGLKIPGVDGNTGQAFDYSIGESVKDAKNNTTCFHKVGDFLSQAAVYLRAQ